MSPAKFYVRLLRVAEDDLTEIITYLAADRPEAALKLVERFERKLEQLASNPHIGGAVSSENLITLGYRYLIFYIIKSKVVVIHRIIHGARDYKGVL